MKDTRTPEQRAAIRELNEQLIHLEGWGGPLKTKDDVNEYLANARYQVDGAGQWKKNYSDRFLTLFTWLSIRGEHLTFGNVHLLDFINNVSLGWQRDAARSWKKEVAIIEAWVKQYKMLFK